MIQIIPLGMQYLVWHYTESFAGFFSITRTFLWFEIRFFSIPLLLRTFFQPLKRLSESYPKGINVEAFASALVVNTLMRIVGMIVRLVFFTIATFFLLATILLAGLCFVIWTGLPLVLVGLFIFGFTMLPL